jgi:agmatinase
VTPVHPDQFLGLPPCGEDRADVIILPLPLEMTVSYGTGTWRAPRAILDASCQVEVFDEETLVDFSESPRVHTLPPFLARGKLEDYLRALARHAAPLRDKFVLGLGGEHSVTYGLVTGLVQEPAKLTIVQIDAHADLIDELDGRHWSHGTVMRRLWEQGCRLVQIGLRSLSRSEYELATGDDRITPYFAHQLPGKWPEVLDVLRGLEGDVYLTVDVDGLDPSVIPSTGTPQPNGLSWGQTMEVFRTLNVAGHCRLVGADVVELVASPHPPGCDLIVAKLVAKLLAFRWIGLGT